MKQCIATILLGTILIGSMGWAQTTPETATPGGNDPIVNMHQQIAAANRAYDGKVAAAKKAFSQQKAAAAKARDAAIAAARSGAGQ